MRTTDSKENEKPLFSQKVWLVGGILSLILITLLLLKTFFSILLLVLAGILMAIYFHGFAALLEKLVRLPPKIAVLFSVLLNLVLLIGFFWFVGERLQHQVTQLSESLPSTFDNAKEWIKQYPAGDTVLGYLKSSGDSEKNLSVAKKFFSSSLGILSDIYIVVLLGLFFTASPLMYKKGIVKLLPPTAKARGENLLDKIHEVLKNWIKGQLFGFVFIAVLTGAGLWIIGMPLILTLALVAGLMNFIPNFGPIIALVPAFLLALMQGTTTALIVVCLYTGIQIVQSAVTQPLIQQKMVNIPPALIIFGQVAMGLLGGFWGILLATPIIAILMNVIDDLYVKSQSDHVGNLNNPNR